MSLRNTNSSRDHWNIWKKKLASLESNYKVNSTSHYKKLIVFYYPIYTIDTQDKVICNENMNYAKIQNKEKESENTQDI